MSKTGLIISREYTTRVRKKTFIIMSILGPVIFAVLLFLPTYFAQLEDTEVKTIAVVDSSHLFIDKIPETEYIKFEYLEGVSIEQAKDLFPRRDYYAILFISHIISYVPDAVILYSNKQPTLGVKNHIENALEKQIEHQKMDAYGIDKEVLSSINTNINLTTIKWNKEGVAQESHTELAMIVGYISGFLIYFFIFLFGAQIMRGVIEEKSNRIIEVIVSSVKPFKIMMGKIIGVGLVGLTQFIIWVALTAVLAIALQAVFFPEMTKTPSSEQVVAQDIFDANSMQKGSNMLDQEDLNKEQQQMQELRGIFSSFRAIDFIVILGSFLLFFLGGYLLYASLFAAIGAAVDKETDTQQFMLPVTIPLILAILVMVNAIQNPESALSFWFSIIPFTSPIVMMVRIPFGVPYWEITLSLVVLILTFMATTWLSARIYRIGILMYGKKVNYKELWKWIRQ